MGMGTTAADFFGLIPLRFGLKSKAFAVPEPFEVTTRGSTGIAAGRGTVRAATGDCECLGEASMREVMWCGTDHSMEAVEVVVQFDFRRRWPHGGFCICME